ncbi:MAG: RDD family protein [Naasia sp.]
MTDPDDLLPVDEHEVVVGEAVGLDVRAASLIQRGAALIIDVIASAVVIIGALLAAGYLAGPSGLDESALAAVVIGLLVTVLVILPMIVEFATRGRSLGKLALGLRIVRDDGGAIGFRHAFIRALTGLLDVWFTFGGLAAVIGLLSPRSKRLGDLLAGTYAQVERVPQPQTAIWAVPDALVGWAAIADVARLPDPLSRRVAAFMASATAMTPDSRRRQAASLAQAVSIHVSPWPDADPELVLAAVSTLRREREAEALRLERQRIDALAPVLTAHPHRFPDR